MKYIKYFIVISCIFTTSCLCFIGREDKEPWDHLIRRVYKINGTEITDNILYGYDAYFTRREIKFRGKLSGKVTVKIYQYRDIKKRKAGAEEIIFDKGVINYERFGEWYSADCIIEITPEDESVTGEIEFTFKAIAYRSGRISDNHKEDRGY